MQKTWPFAKRERESRLKMQRLVAGATAVEQRIKTTIPADDSLQRLAADVIGTIVVARQRMARMRSLLSLPRIRFYVTLFAFAWVSWWIFASYLQSGLVRIATTREDLLVLENRTARENVSDIQFVNSSGSPHNIELIQNGSADVAVIQGGIGIPADFRVLGTVYKEHVLYFLRDGAAIEGSLNVLTYSRGQGSEVLAREFFETWERGDVTWVYAWERFVNDGGYSPPPEVSSIFVVVDPTDPATRTAIGTGGQRWVSSE